MTEVVGTWELVSYVTELDDGRVIEPWPDPVGRIFYSAHGQMIALVMSGRRNEAAGAASPTDAQGEFTAYFGTYVIDAGRGVIRHRIAGSLSAARAAKELERSFQFRDGMLNLSFPAVRDGVRGMNRLVWKRRNDGD